MPRNVEIVPMKNENIVPGRRSIWIISQRSALFLKKMSKIIKTWAITMIISISDNEYIQKFLTKELFKIILSSQFINKFNFRFQSHVFSSIDIFALWTIWVELFFWVFKLPFNVCLLCWIFYHKTGIERKKRWKSHILCFGGIFWGFFDFILNFWHRTVMWRFWGFKTLLLKQFRQNLK